MLTLLVDGQQLFSDGDGLAVEIFAQGDTRKLEECRYDVCVAGRNSLDCTLRHSWSADEERNIHVFFDVATFSGRQAMLTNVEAVIRGVD